MGQLNRSFKLVPSPILTTSTRSRSIRGNSFPVRRSITWLVPRPNLETRSHSCSIVPLRNSSPDMLQLVPRPLESVHLGCGSSLVTPQVKKYKLHFITRSQTWNGDSFPVYCPISQLVPRPQTGNDTEGILVICNWGAVLPLINK